MKLDPEKLEHKSPAHLARNPMGAVPVLEIDGITMHESDSICWFLVEKFGKLVPAVGTAERAACLQWFHFSSGTLGYANQSRWPLKNLPEFAEGVKTPDGKPAKEFLADTKKGVEEDFQNALSVLEARLAKRDFLLGEFSIADIPMAYSLAWLNVKGELARYPALQAYVARNKARPAAMEAGAFLNK